MTQRILNLLAVCVAGLALATPAAALASHPLVFGLASSAEVDQAAPSAVFGRLHTAAISTLDVPLDWVGTAPASEPASWAPSNPDDAHYNWSPTDARVRQVVAGAVQPIFVLDAAPSWARLLPQFLHSAPNVEDFAAFMHAAALRYDGRHGVPRVRIWRIWSEPNISLYFRPQIDAQKKFVSPDIYREMVNRAAAEIHSVHADNLVVAGGTAPFSDISPDVKAVDPDWGPLKFMQRLLCVNAKGRPTCGNRIDFDVWSTHPYTSGGPQRHAQRPYDVSLGDLPRMRATLGAAVRAGHVKSLARPRFWVTEFSWDSKPPDPCAVPMSLLRRWVPEAFFRMWASGIDHITWFRLMDDPLTQTILQSGLYLYAPSLNDARPKGFFEAFRLPFVALRRGGGVYVWAHTPLGKPALITVEHLSAGRWSAVRRLRTDRYGIVQATLRVAPVGQFRAVLANGERSLPFSMRVPRDHYYSPFGQDVLTPRPGEKC